MPPLTASLGVHSVPLREHLDTDLTGDGVTIAFIDMGFTPHPDLTRHRNRIVAYVDTTGEDVALDGPLEANRWHGTQTTVVAAGDGHMSGGLYRGVAPDAHLALVRVSTHEMDVTVDNVRRGFEWVLQWREALGIRVVNVSLGVRENAEVLDALAELAVESGLVVVTSVGNSGHRGDHTAEPPADAPSVLTVGAFQDHDGEAFDLWWDSSWDTADGRVKPEVLALGCLVPAPILPGTDVFRRADLLARLAHARGDRLRHLLDVLGPELGLPGWLGGCDDDDIHAYVAPMLAQDKIVAPHYQHVDGTSFASAICSGVVAQMLQANPSLSPRMVKHALICTADRLSGVPSAQQGFGMINPRRAVEVARGALPSLDPSPPHVHRGQLVFRLYMPGAASVAVAGSFDGWQAHALTPRGDGRFVARLPLPAPGTYAYKYCIDGTRWMRDPSNGLQTDDGFGGRNSLLSIR